jgi:hypothetical protein
MKDFGFKNLLIVTKGRDLKLLKTLINSKKTLYHQSNFIKENFQLTGKIKIP